MNGINSSVNYLAHLRLRLSGTSTDDRHKQELLFFLDQFKSKAFSATSDVIKKEKGLVEYFCKLVRKDIPSSSPLLKAFNNELRDKLTQPGNPLLKTKDLYTRWGGTNVIPKQDIIKNIIFKYCIELSYNHGNYTNYDISTTDLVQKPITRVASDQQQILSPTTESDFSKIFKTIVYIALNLDEKSYGELINSDFSNFEKVKKHLLINGASISADVKRPIKLVDTLFDPDSSITLTFQIPTETPEVLSGSSIIGRGPYSVATDTLSHDNINTLKSFIGPYRKIGYINVSLEGFNYQCDGSLGDLLGKINESPLDESLKLRRLPSGNPITFDDLHNWLRHLPKEHFKLNAAKKLQQLAALKPLAKPLSQPLTADTKDALIDEINAYLTDGQKIPDSGKYMDLLRHLDDLVSEEAAKAELSSVLDELKGLGVVVAAADIALDGQNKQEIIDCINGYLPEGYKVTNDDSPYAAVLAELHGVVQRVGQVYARFLQLTGKDHSALIGSIQSEDQPVVNKLRSFLIDGDKFEFGYNALLNPFQNLDQLLRAFKDKFYTQILEFGIITEDVKDCPVLPDSIYYNFEVKIRELMPQIIVNYNGSKALLGGEFDFFDTFYVSEPIPAYACLIDLAKQISNGLYSDGQAEAESKEVILKTIIADVSKLNSYSERVFDCYKQKLTALAIEKRLEAFKFEQISNYDQLQDALGLKQMTSGSSLLVPSIGSTDGSFVSHEAPTGSPTASPTTKTTGHKMNMSGRKPFNELYNAFKNPEVNLGSASVKLWKGYVKQFSPAFSGTDSVEPKDNSLNGTASASVSISEPEVNPVDEFNQLFGQKGRVLPVIKILVEPDFKFDPELTNNDVLLMFNILTLHKNSTDDTLFAFVDEITEQLYNKYINEELFDIFTDKVGLSFIEFNSLNTDLDRFNVLKDCLNSVLNSGS